MNKVHVSTGEWAEPLMRRVRAICVLLFALALCTSLVACESDGSKKDTQNSAAPTPLPPTAAATVTTSTLAGIATPETANPPVTEGTQGTPGNAAVASTPGFTATPEAATTPQTGAAPPTSEDLIDKALKSKAIDEETALIYKVYAAFGDPSLPAAYRGDYSLVFDSLIMDEAAERFDKLSPKTQAILRPFFIPPAYPGSWAERYQVGSTPFSALEPSFRLMAYLGNREQSYQVEPPVPNRPPDLPKKNWKFLYASQQVKVWWQSSRRDDEQKATFIVNAIDNKIWTSLTVLMGTEPVADVGEAYNGGDDRLDIYLFSLQYLGKYSGINIPYPGGCKKWPSYILIRPEAVSEDTLTHELMHAFQRWYDLAGACTDYSWWVEATAAWAEDYVYPKGSHNYEGTFTPNPEHDYGKAFYLAPERSLDTGDGYAQYVFPFYLNYEFPAGARNIVQRIWFNDQLYGPLEAIDKALPGGFKEVWPDFVLYNWNRGPHIEYQTWDKIQQGAIARVVANAKTTYDPPLFSPAALAETGQNGERKYELQLPPSSSGSGASLPHLSAAYYHFKFDDINARSVTFLNGLSYKWYTTQQPGDPTKSVHYDYEHELGVPVIPPKGASVQAMIKYEGQPWKVEDWTYRPSYFACRDARAERLEELVIVLSNSNYDKSSAPIRPQGLAPTLLVSNIGCWRWSGSYKHVEHANGMVEYNEKHTIEATFVWEREEPGNAYDFCSFDKCLRFKLNSMVITNYACTGEDPGVDSKENQYQICSAKRVSDSVDGYLTIFHMIVSGPLWRLVEGQDDSKNYSCHWEVHNGPNGPMFGPFDDECGSGLVFRYLEPDPRKDGWHNVYVKPDGTINDTMTNEESGWVVTLNLKPEREP